MRHINKSCIDVL